MRNLEILRSEVSRATLGRIPTYLKYLEALPAEMLNISATTIAKELGFGEVQVRKDLGAVSGKGKPKIGYNKAVLITSLEKFLGRSNLTGVIIIGAGKLGRALLDYDGFTEYGLEILAAFDNLVQKPIKSDARKNIFPITELEDFCKLGKAKIGIITVPAASAQEACDHLVINNIQKIWSFAQCRLTVPPDIAVQYENMALSLAHLKAQRPLV